MATRSIQFTGMEERHTPKSELLPARSWPGTSKEFGVELGQCCVLVFSTSICLPAGVTAPAGISFLHDNMPV